MKVLENCNTIVAASLQQTKWSRKNLQVRRAEPDPDTTQTTVGSFNETDRTLSSDNTVVDFDGQYIQINSLKNIICFI